MIRPRPNKLAVAALEQGADTFVTIANAGDPAVIEAVNEAYKAGNKDVRLLSWSTDKHELGPDFVSSGLAQDSTVAIDRSALTGDRRGPAWRPLHPRLPRRRALYLLPLL